MKKIIVLLILLSLASIANAATFTKLDDITYVYQASISTTATTVTSNIEYDGTWAIFPSEDLYIDLAASTPNSSDITIPGKGYFDTAGVKGKHTIIISTTGIKVAGVSTTANTTFIIQLERE